LPSHCVPWSRGCLASGGPKEEFSWMILIFFSHSLSLPLSLSVCLSLTHTHTPCTQVQFLLHMWEQRLERLRDQSSCRSCPFSFLLWTMLLHRQPELDVVLWQDVCRTGDSLRAESGSACFEVGSWGTDGNPAPTITFAWHDRRELQQEPRPANCESETQNDVSRILDHYSQ